MFAIVTDDRSGEELARYKLEDEDFVDPEGWAERYALEMGFSLAPKDGYVPSGCGDFTVTVQDVPGAVRCWNSESFFIGED